MTDITKTCPQCRRERQICWAVGIRDAERIAKTMEYAPELLEALKDLQHDVEAWAEDEEHTEIVNCDSMCRARLLLAKLDAK